MPVQHQDAGGIERPVAAPGAAFDRKTRVLLDAPIVPTLLRLAGPNMAMMVVQSSIGLVELYFIGKLGTDALAGVALVVPVMMLMQMMSSGAMGGGISAAVARALGGGRRDEANALVLHALVIAAAFGIGFTLLMLAGGPWLYRTLGGRDASLAAALTYSNLIFSGIVVMWTYNSLANAIRGTGNMLVPACVTVVGAVAAMCLAPCLILGLGPFPHLGLVGGPVATIAFYAVGTLVFAFYLRSGRSLVRLSFRRTTFRWLLFRDILKVGLLASLVSFQTNLIIAITTGFIGQFGPAAIAGYGSASRLEYLMVPIAFGIGGPLVALVATNMGAGQPERALRAAWIGVGIVAGLTELIGLWAAFFPYAWLTLFDTDPAMLEFGASYLRIVGPLYGMFGLGIAIYFASQGAGRLLWPLVANFTRLVIACGGGWLALHWGGGPEYVFVGLSLGFAVYGALSAGSLARGAWSPRNGTVPQSSKRSY